MSTVTGTLDDVEAQHPPPPPIEQAPITDPNDIPEPMAEAAAADYYSTHGFTAEALDRLPDGTEQFAGSFVRTRPVSIRFPEPMLDELKSLAARKGVAYQALIKIWLDERLQRERRHAAPPVRP
ncbi:MAG: BrnA antitoxin family protein [Chloroflexota bacterium]|nr:BrnA antitoxin family protein [Chloroflexota bacterium]